MLANGGRSNTVSGIVTESALRGPTIVLKCVDAAFTAIYRVCLSL